MSVLRRVWTVWTAPRGRPHWRVFLAATGIAAAVGIPVVMLFPLTVPLVWLCVVGIPANSPLSPLFPTAFEPLVMEAAKHLPALTVTAVGTGVFVYMEFINWVVYRWVLNWDRLTKLRGSRWVEWGIKRFDTSPYWTVFVFAATPLPFWIVRCIAILGDVSFTRYMIAMALGRFPRLYVYAWLGDRFFIQVWILAAVAVGTCVPIIAWRLIRREPLLKDTVLD